MSKGRCGSKHFEELETKGTLGSGLEQLCKQPDKELNSACLNIKETSPRVAWKLPKVSPSDVYAGISRFHFRALSRIKIKERSIRTKLNLNAMIPLLEPKHIQAALKSGYKYVHLGMVRVGINALHIKGQKTFVRWDSFTKALIGGVETTLSEGPVQYDVFPDFSVALDDPHILNCLTLGVHTKGYEGFLSEAKNLTIFYVTCVRFYNTTIPAVLHSASDSGAVTLIHYDSACNPRAPVSVSKRDLIPPDDCVTNWRKPAKRPVARAQSFITETDGRVVIRFPSVQPA